ncbi:inositol monophosphatase [Candidatus Woesearchaeota archaeon]|nr:inositol monophosphatase [Candidatus Woesearchaeota archaeon]
MKSLIIKAAKDAGKLLMRNYGKVKYVREKDQESYFTNVDVESEKLIISAIRKNFPGHNIISEESGNANKASEYTWYIDPLDGTHNYIKKFPLFGTSIALEHKGQVKFGAINLPYFNELYFAEKGRGAFLNGKRIRVSSQKNIKKSFVVTDLALRHYPEDKIRIIKKLKGKVYDLRVLGCAVYDYAMIARGSADAYITRYTNAWDMAAGGLIVEEAGGRVTDFDGKRWNTNMSRFVSSNGKIHGQLLKVLRQHVQ